MPLFPNVTSIKLICDHTDSTHDGILEGFVANKAEEYDEVRSELVWGAKDQQSFYECLRDIWKNQHNVSFPPLEVLVTEEYLWFYKRPIITDDSSTFWSSQIKQWRL